MDDLISKLHARRESLARELAQVDAVLAEHARINDEIARLVGETPSEANPKPSEERRHPAQVIDVTRSKRGPNGSPPDEIAAAAEFIILERGEPMTRFELIEPIEGMGIRIGGVDKPRNLGTVLWRSKKFESTGDGYWPKGKSKESAEMPHFEKDLDL